MHDPIADMFIQIKNAQAVHKPTVVIPASKLKENIARVLKENGYIDSWERQAGKPGDKLLLTLRYEGKNPAITEIKRVSKPGLRRYSSVETFPRPLSGHGLVIVSTTQGVMSSRQAEKAGIGGEVIATIW